MKYTIKNYTFICIDIPYKKMSIARVNNNVIAMGSYRNLSIVQNSLNNNVRHFSTGLRIEGSRDDAAGLAISESFRSQIIGYETANKNAQDAGNLLQVADGSLNETHSILQRLRQLATTSANEATTDADRNNIQTESNQLLDELDNIARTTQYNGRKLMDGNLSGSKSAVNGMAEIVQNSYVSISATQGTSQTALVSSAAVASTYSGENLTYEIRLVGGSGAGSVMAQVYQSGSINSTTGAYNVITSVDVSTGTPAITVGGATITLNVSGTADIGKTAFVRVTSQEAALTVDKSISFQVRANQGQAIGVSMNDMSTDGLRIQKLKMTDRLSGQNAIGMLDDAIEKVSRQRASIGALQQRINSIVSGNELNILNQKADESRIRDVDFAQETLSFTRSNILVQSGTAVLAQANVAPKSVMSLLTG